MSSLVSIILPVHGEAPYLKKTLVSISRQSLRDFEVIVVLDRASKSTQDLVVSKDLGIRNLHVLQSKKPGISAALNTGISESSAQLVARIDADDVMAPHRLQVQAEALASSSDLVCIGSQVRLIDGLGKEVRKTNLPTNVGQLRFILPHVNCLIHPSVMLRKSAVEKVGGYREYLDGVEDYNLWLRLLTVGEISNSTEFLTDYRIHSGQVTQGRIQVGPYLDSIARLDSLGISMYKPPAGWPSLLNALSHGERESVVRDLELQVSSFRRRNVLRSSRYLNLFISSKTKKRFATFLNSFLRTPFKSLALVFFLYLKDLSRDSKILKRVSK